MKPENQNDIKKWNRFRNGDDLVLSVIYSENAEALYQYGLKLTTNCELVEDTIHDLFLDLIRNRKTIGETDHIRFYLLKSFRRKLIRKLKSEKHDRDLPLSEEVFDVRYSIEQEMISKEISQNTSARLLTAVGQLSPRQKEAIYLKFQKELNYLQISEILGMSVEASRNLIYRAVKSLKEAFPKIGEDAVFLLIFKKYQYPG